MSIKCCGASICLQKTHSHNTTGYGPTGPWSQCQNFRKIHPHSTAFQQTEKTVTTNTTNNFSSCLNRLLSQSYPGLDQVPQNHKLTWEFEVLQSRNVLPVTQPTVSKHWEDQQKKNKIPYFLKQKPPASISTITSDPQPVFEAGLYSRPGLY